MPFLGQNSERPQGKYMLCLLSYLSGRETHSLVKKANSVPPTLNQSEIMQNTQLWVKLSISACSINIF